MVCAVCLNAQLCFRFRLEGYSHPDSRCPPNGSSYAALGLFYAWLDERYARIPDRNDIVSLSASVPLSVCDRTASMSTQSGTVSGRRHGRFSFVSGLFVNT